MVKIKSLSEDRLIGGIIAGAIGGIIQNIYGTTVKALGLTDRAFVDFAAVLATFKVHNGISGYLVVSLFHLVFCAILGVIFAYFIKTTTSKYYWIKAVGYGLSLWFITLSAGTVFQLPLFKDIPLRSTYSTLIGALIYALVLGWVLRYLERKTDLI